MTKHTTRDAWLPLALGLLGLLLNPPGCQEDSPTEQLQSVTLTGKVQVLNSPRGEATPLAGATVSLYSSTPTPRIQVTDSAGVFSFDKVAVGMHEISISHQLIPTIDTVVDVSTTTGMLSFIQFTGLTDIFPLAVGASWLYDFTCRHYEAYAWNTDWHSSWWKGTERFTVLSVSDAGTEWRWTIREKDDNMFYDTVWTESGGYTIQPEAHLTADFTFSMYEEKTGMHRMRTDSCSALWKVPWQGAGAADPGDPTLNYNLTRYLWASADTVVYQKPARAGGPILESRSLVGGVGLVQCYLIFVNRVASPSNYTWWGTLRSYTPGQGAGAQNSVGLGRNYFNSR